MASRDIAINPRPALVPGVFHSGDRIMSWTDDRIQQLKTLWAEGHSISTIADRLGQTTRNAVIGKIHRLGLGGRRKTQGPKKPRRPAAPVAPRRRTVSVSRGQPVAMTADIIAAELAKLGPGPEPRVTVQTLTASTCRWPEGDPCMPGFHFCGRKPAATGPYCGPHDWIAHDH
jgi:GcrA cell cycle regulator